LGGENKFLGGKTFVLLLVALKFFWAQQNLGWSQKEFGGHCPGCPWAWL